MFLCGLKDCQKIGKVDDEKQKMTNKSRDQFKNAFVGQNQLKDLRNIKLK